jgi:hypothetical protein
LICMTANISQFSPTNMKFFPKIEYLAMFVSKKPHDITWNLY